MRFSIWKFRLDRCVAREVRRVPEWTTFDGCFGDVGKSVGSATNAVAKVYCITFCACAHVRNARCVKYSYMLVSRTRYNNICNVIKLRGSRRTLPEGNVSRPSYTVYYRCVSFTFTGYLLSRRRCRRCWPSIAC